MQLLVRLRQPPLSNTVCVAYSNSRCTPISPQQTSSEDNIKDAFHLFPGYSQSKPQCAAFIVFQAVEKMDSRSSSGFHKLFSSLRRPSNTPSTRTRPRTPQDWRNNEPQCISGEYIVPQRLEAALRRNWNTQYAVEMRSNEYRIRAPGKLSDDEIRTFYSPGYY
ncbi:hypothetical protein J3F83DRAFT_749665 [Trichoderma novae-zelandiae]